MTDRRSRQTCFSISFDPSGMACYAFSFLLVFNTAGSFATTNAAQPKYGGIKMVNLSRDDDDTGCNRRVYRMHFKHKVLCFDLLLLLLSTLWRFFLIAHMLFTTNNKMEHDAEDEEASNIERCSQHKRQCCVLFVFLLSGVDMNVT